MSHAQKFLLLGILLFSVFVVQRDASRRVELLGGGEALRGAQNASLPSVFLPETPRFEEYASAPAGSGDRPSGSLLGSSAGIRPAPFTPSGGDLTVPELAVEAALVADLRTGESYYDYAGARRWPIASVSKLMTAVVALQDLRMDDLILISEEDIPPDTAVRIVAPGERYTVRDAVNIMLLASSNEAAEALANAYGRGEFVYRMNGLAEAWGLEDTFFADPTGLSPANQSTAKDMAGMALMIYNRYPEVFRVTREPSMSVLERTSGTERVIQNINAFAGRDDFLGGKTGYTDQSQGNLLSIFLHGGRPVVFIVLGTADRFGETQKLLHWFTNAFSASD